MPITKDSLIIRAKRLLKPSKPLMLLLGGAVGIVVLIALSTWFLLTWFFPQRLVPVDVTDAKERAELVNANRDMSLKLIQTVGGLGFIATAYFAWQNLRISGRNLQISEDKQVTERFSKAVEMLADERRMTVRLGGIYTLERIARDSPEDSKTIMEVLAAFIREKSPIQELIDEQSFLSTDIHAALSVIRDQTVGKEKLPAVTSDNGGKYLQPLDLNNSNLRKANLSGAVLDWANFNSTNLTEANLSDASLYKANLSDASLCKANLNSANLTSADLSNANLAQTELVKADLTGADLNSAILMDAAMDSANLSYTCLTHSPLNHANLSNADLSGAFLWRSDLSNAHLNNTNLSNADLSEAQLSNAYIGGANLNSTDLSDANLHGAKHWTDEQLSQAKLCNTTLPEGSKLDPNRDC